MRFPVKSFIALAAVICAGCSGIGYDTCVYRDMSGGDLAGQSYFEYNCYRYDVVSEPPGAKVELNGKYIGTTPLSDSYSGKAARDDKLVIDIISPGEIGESHRRVLYPGRQRLPRKLYFEMDGTKNE